mgnify:CR=1 FL=1
MKRYDSYKNSGVEWIGEIPSHWECKKLKYDLELLQNTFATSFEQVAHRVTCLQDPKLPGIPFHFLRVDMAGNISKRFSLSGIDIPRYGGACPRWNVYSALTRPGVIQAAVDMLKKARKEDAQKIYAKMAKVDESEDDGSVDKSIKAAPQKKNDLKAKAKVESVDFSEDLDAVIAEEATLSDGFRGKAGAIFEAVLTSKLSEEVERLEAEYAQNLEEEVSEVQSSLVEKVDSYLNYVVENWINENEVAIEAGLRTEIAEQFMDSLQTVFKEHYIEVPEGKANLIDDLADQVAELEEQLNKTTEDNIQLHEKSQSFERADVVRRQSSGLAVTEAERLASLVEDIDFDDAQTFEMKVKTIKESYFDKEVKESVDEADALAGEQDNTLTESKSSSMNAYTQAISKHIK